MTTRETTNMSDWERMHIRSYSDETSCYEVKFPQGATLTDLIAYALSRTGELGNIEIMKLHPIYGCEVVYKLEYEYGKIKADNIPEDMKGRKLEVVMGYGGYALMDYTIAL